MSAPRETYPPMADSSSASLADFYGRDYLVGFRHGHLVLTPFRDLGRRKKR